jgi:hypothetical protein
MTTRHGASFSSHDIAPLELTADDPVAFFINAVVLKHRFGECHVPVEEASTASLANLG